MTTTIDEMTLSDLGRFIASRTGDLDAAAIAHSSAPPPGALPQPDCSGALPQPVAGDRPAEAEAEIRRLREQGLSLNAIQERVFGYCGGAAYQAVRAALR